jgi:hypothetical protein
MRKNLLSHIELQSGNVAYNYRYQDTCRYTSEVGPETDLIVAVSWKGEAQHCTIIPKSRRPVFAPPINNKSIYFQEPCFTHNQP